MTWSVSVCAEYCGRLVACRGMQLLWSSKYSLLGVLLVSTKHDREHEQEREYMYECEYKGEDKWPQHDSWQIFRGAAWVQYNSPATCSPARVFVIIYREHLPR